MKYVLDTCVISELIKSQPDPKCAKWIKSHDPLSYFISVLTVGEIRKGISKMITSKKRQQLEEWFATEFLPYFKSRILPIDENVATAWGDLLAASENSGKPLPTIDSLIGATASAHNLTLVTRNVKDFSQLNLEIINPWIL